MCISRLGVRLSWRLCFGIHWQRYQLSSTDTLDPNTLWELIINSVNRCHNKKDQKHLTLLSLLEPTTRCTESFQEMTLQQMSSLISAAPVEENYSSDILGDAPFRFTCPLKLYCIVELLYCTEVFTSHTRWPCLSGSSGSFYGQRGLFAHGNI